MAAKSPLGEACGSSIFNVSLSRSMAPRGEAGQRVLLQLLDGARRLGIGVMNTAIYDVAEVRDAQAHPEAHGDLIVRVWGYSARFVDLCEEMQNYVIARMLAGWARRRKVVKEQPSPPDTRSLVSPRGRVLGRRRHHRVCVA